MDVSQAPLSGRIYTDSLVQGPVWSARSLTFSFPAAAHQFTGYSGGEPTQAFEALNGVQQAAVRAMLSSIAGFTGLVFTELTGTDAANAVLRFGMTDGVDPGSIAHAYFPSTSDAGGDAWFLNSGGENDNPVRGNEAWHTFQHEIGHTLGLAHPHEPIGSEPAMPADRDAMAYTVMSYRSAPNAGLGYYNEAGGFAQTFMMEDIAALQFLYGANFAHNGGDSVYRWDAATGEMAINGVGQGAPAANRVFMTVWDGGGTDTYDFSNHTGWSATIDLRPGEWSLMSAGQNPDLGSATRPPGNIANALMFGGDQRSLIENAIGTGGDDLMIGNVKANVLSGGPGRDRLFGEAGDDTLYGGGDIDELHGGEGNDTLDGGAMVDYLYGGAGEDILYGTDGQDHLYGEAGHDTLYFGKGMAPYSSIADGGEGTDVVVLQGSYDFALTYNSLANVEYLSLQSGATTRWGDVEGNRYSYALTTHQANVAAGRQLVVNAQSLLAGEDLTFNGAAETDGSFLLYGGHGTDRAIGGAGNDVFFFEGARWGTSDTVDGGNGRDALMLASGNGLNRFVFGEDSLVGLESISVNNRFASDPSQVPSYELVLANGNVAAGRTLIVNASSLAAGQRLILDGSFELDGSLAIFGGAGEDSIVASAGSDVLYGGDGSDTLVGGAGNDIFRYDAISHSNPNARDAILDFFLYDAVDLSRIDADATAGGDQAFAIIGEAAFSGTAGQLRIENAGGSFWWLRGDTDGDGAADFELLLKVADLDPITASDFVL